MRETIQQSRSSPKINPLPMLPTNYKFLSNSLPSSPRIGGSFKTKDNIQNHTPNHNSSLARSPLTCVSNARLQRSKSGGEDRSYVPYGGSDLWANLNNTSEDKSSKNHGNGNINNGRTMMSNKFKKPTEMDFKCGALCLFLPGFGKAKPVRARRMEEKEVIRNVISQRVSLEKFECGSWTSSAIHCDDDHTSTLYFDLPLELIRTSVSDNALPMNSAFLFNKGSSVKGVLKTKTGPVERKSQEGRHVRFSTSSPTTQPTSPITPRLRKARDDFNAFLEAQSA
uniref:uncharacterized protein LOC122604475 n=1 Tax=Erigeron canadensis TaxID=72917 RepID=UPI001CB8A323|nr:uncharacterized protein LOC122604475 [Erigeron canadensis]